MSEPSDGAVEIARRYIESQQRDMHGNIIEKALIPLCAKEIDAHAAKGVEKRDENHQVTLLRICGDRDKFEQLYESERAKVVELEKEIQWANCQLKERNETVHELQKRRNRDNDLFDTLNVELEQIPALAEEKSELKAENAKLTKWAALFLDEANQLACGQALRQGLKSAEPFFSKEAWKEGEAFGEYRDALAPIEGEES